MAHILILSSGFSFELLMIFWCINLIWRFSTPIAPIEPSLAHALFWHLSLLKYIWNICYLRYTHLVYHILKCSKQIWYIFYAFCNWCNMAYKSHLESMSSGPSIQVVSRAYCLFYVQAWIKTKGLFSDFLIDYVKSSWEQINLVSKGMGYIVCIWCALPVQWTDLYVIKETHI